VTLKKLVSSEVVPEHMRTAFEKGRVELSSQGLRVPAIMQLMKRLLLHYRHPFDKCFPKHPPEPLGPLKDILYELPRTRIFVTGRPLIEAEIIRYFGTGIIIPINPSTKNIKRYLGENLEIYTMPYAMSDAFREDILTITGKSLNNVERYP